MADCILNPLNGLCLGVIGEGGIIRSGSLKTGSGSKRERGSGRGRARLKAWEAFFFDAGQPIKKYERTTRLKAEKGKPHGPWRAKLQEEKKSKSDVALCTERKPIIYYNYFLFIRFYYLKIIKIYPKKINNKKQYYILFSSKRFFFSVTALATATNFPCFRAHATSFHCTDTDPI